MNQQAFKKLKIKDKRLDIMPGATHLFEEPGKLEEVACLAQECLSVICLSDPCGILALFVF
jgi:hypothetical protein